MKGERFSMKVGEFEPVSVSLPRNLGSLVTPPSASDRDNVATIPTFQSGHNKVDNSDKITQPRKMSMNPEKVLESMLKMFKSYSFVDGYQFLHMQEILGCEEKFKTKIFLHIVKLREREGQGVDPGRSLKGHLWMVDGGWWYTFP